MNNSNSRIESLEEKMDKVLSLFQKVLGNNVEDPNVRVVDESQFSIDLLADIEELNTYENILDQLNQSGDALGYSFKKGPMTKEKGKPASALTIVCKYYNRNPTRTTNNEGINSNSQIKDVNCKSFYRFNVSSDGSVYRTTYNQIHNHGPNTSVKVELIDAMKLEISRFTKKDKVSAINPFAWGKNEFSVAA